jgi:thioredoxin reductase (NADPH)
MDLVDVIIVGAGPSGLAAAIAAGKRGVDYVLLERGLLVNSIYRFPTHMVFFTTPELLEIGGLPFVSPNEKPTRFEALRYYRRVADTCGIRVEFGQEVLRIARDAGGTPPTFLVHAAGADGPRTWRARAVLVATGYYDHPNLLGVPGEDLPHVQHYYRDAHAHYRQRVVVVGGSNSAAEAALELHRGGARRVTLVHRGRDFNAGIKYWVLPDLQNRIRDGAIEARMGCQVVEIRRDAVRIEGGGRRDDLPADAVLLLTGYHPDRDLLQGAGVCLDPVTRLPRHDPETLETNVADLFRAGGVISGIGTAPVFIENGRLHGERALRVIAARLGRGDGGTT